MFYVFILLSTAIHLIHGLSSPITPYTSYDHSTELAVDVADLWWTFDEAKQEITFELHVQTTGWIALGISPAGGMAGADIGVGWIDDSGELYFQDRYTSDYVTPVVDNTTTNWFGIQGREENGWTVIQFKRAIDTCDKMDVVIKSGTNILIYAYGLTDPNGDITYHETRRGSRILSLKTYADPPAESKFASDEYFDFRLKNYSIPTTETTYVCKVYKVPATFATKRHVIAAKFLIDEDHRDLLHHILMYECDPSVKFNDSNLPQGNCSQLQSKISLCRFSISIGWAVGGDLIDEYPPEAGYPMGNDLPVKYYMIETHITNVQKKTGIKDNSGIRFYLGSELRQYDLGFLTFGTTPDMVSLVIPPNADRFIVDSYCPAATTNMYPNDGLTVISAFPHAHLQGRSIWTKIIRNGTAVEYLFNGEIFNFNYQFSNRLVNPIKLYPGDELATRCIYSTTNKNTATLGGEETSDEMCLHIFAYYPRINRTSGCLTMNSYFAWQALMGASTSAIFSLSAFKNWTLGINWTPEKIVEWQNFYDRASRFVVAGTAANAQISILDHLPEYKDLKSDQCNQTTTTDSNGMKINYNYINSLFIFSFSILICVLNY